MNEKTRGLFVLGTGRCGSTLLSNLLRAHPEVLSLSEWFTALGGAPALDEVELDGPEILARLNRFDPDFAAHLRAARVPEVLWDLATIERAAPGRPPPPLLTVPLPHLFDDPIAWFARIEAEVIRYPRASLSSHYERLFTWLAAQLGKCVWVERSGGSLEYAEELAARFPEARYVCLVRAGEDTALSMAEHPFFRVRLARVLKRDPALPVELALGDALPLDRFGAYWSALMGKAKRFVMQRGPGEVHLMIYEDLVRAPEPELTALAHFIGVEPHAEWLRNAAVLVKLKPSRKAELASEPRLRLERSCKPGRDALEALRRALRARHP